ncbi:MAG: Zinc finger protein [Candidatus Methanohalarchaeum thermophilum]|uniref:Zinc finger protein n=1 Tax=Methanohalarchaeum thermophilum TaxID=1903181 RepID=A0A1Q6DV00_METT1|nr:MAG: Zinc finger protein [Candidatus Methanohalarchaeum thermophilum]
MYVVFRCPNCKRYLFAAASNKTRKCPCNKKINLDSIKVIKKTKDKKKARKIVQKLQENEYGEPTFMKFN